MDPLRQTARRLPEAPAVVGSAEGGGPSGSGWSFRELDRKADLIAHALVGSGVVRGDRIAMCLPPCAEAVAVLHAVSRAGAVLVPLNPAWTESEVRRGLEAVGGVTRVIDSREQVVDWVGSEIGGESGPDVEFGLPLPDQLVALVLTSGSTGLPRPIGITHGNLAASASRVIQRLDLKTDDRWLTSLSPAYVGGMTLIHRASVVACTLVTRPRFEAAELASLVDKGEITHASLVPVMLKRLLDERGDRRAPGSLRCLLVGGAAVPPTILDRALALGYPIALTYGLTETTSQVATATPTEVRGKAGTVGRPLSGIELRIERAEAGGSGEILVRGPTVATPYLDDDGWLHTGDLGYMDDKGDLWVTGRDSDRIVSGGVTVEPGEVEAVLVQHPEVREVVVVGSPDGEWGERLVAVVVPEDVSRPPTLPDLLEFTRSRLGPAKRPRELKIVQSLPRTANGKLDRRRLRDP